MCYADSGHINTQQLKLPCNRISSMDESWANRKSQLSMQKMRYGCNVGINAKFLKLSKDRISFLDQT
jgi:hypothetical protein